MPSFFKLSSIAKEFGLATHLLRSWVKKHRVSAHKSPSGHYIFTPKDKEDFSKQMSELAAV